MKDVDPVEHKDCKARAFALFDFSAQFPEKRHNIRPFDIAANGAFEYEFKCPLMLARHTLKILNYSTIVNPQFGAFPHVRLGPPLKESGPP